MLKLQKPFSSLLAGLGFFLCSFAFAQSPDSLSTLPQSDTTKSPTNAKRNWVIGGSSVVLFGGTGYFLKNAWWAEQSVPFHFDDGADLRYALNLDKVAHALGGNFVSDLYTRAFIGTGMPAKKAALWGLGMGVLGQVAIETKDGFAPRWGFSPYDLLAGTAGSIYNLGKYHSKFLANTEFKMGYWQRSDKYFSVANKRPKPFSIDDYLNQTYWFTVYPKNLLTGKAQQNFPAWLGISIGDGIEANSWDGLGGGQHELYIAPDVSLERLFKPKRKFFKQVLHFSTYIKIPMPTLQVYPQTKFWWFFL